MDARLRGPSRRGKLSSLLTHSVQLQSSTVSYNAEQSSTAISPIIQPFCRYAFTIEEINDARQALISLGLPTEIANTILGHAEYWCIQRYISHVPLNVEAGMLLTFLESSSLYMQTHPLGYGKDFDEQPLVKPRKVVFRTISKGGGLQERRDGYQVDEDYSWFDVSIFREDESWTDGEREEPVIALFKHAPKSAIPKGGSNMHGRKAPVFYMGKNPDMLPYWLYREESKLVGGFRVVQNEGKPTWFLQRNRIGRKNLREHRVEWKAESFEEEEKSPVNGAGNGKNFVASLQRGDRIGVWARAMYPYAKNIVRSIQIEVYYSIF